VRVAEGYIRQALQKLDVGARRENHWLSNKKRQQADNTTDEESKETGDPRVWSGKQLWFAEVGVN